MRAWRNAVRGPRRESSTSRAGRRIAMRTAQLLATRRLRKGKQLQRQASDAFVCAVVWEVWVTFVRYRVLMQEEEEVVTVMYVARQMVPVGHLRTCVES
jgi:urease gamma subunit